MYKTGLSFHPLKIFVLICPVDHRKTAPQLVKGLFSIFSSVISTVLLATSFYSVWKIYTTFGGLVTSQCGDKATQSMFQSYNEEITTMMWLDSFVLVWGVVSVIIFFLSFFFLFWKTTGSLILFFLSFFTCRSLPIFI